MIKNINHGSNAFALNHKSFSCHPPNRWFVCHYRRIIFKSETLRRTAFCILVVNAITAVIAISSGEVAENVVNKIPEVDQHLIKEQEEVAEVFIKLICFLGVVSLLLLWSKKKKKPLSK